MLASASALHSGHAQPLHCGLCALQPLHLPGASVHCSLCTYQEPLCTAPVHVHPKERTHCHHDQPNSAVWSLVGLDLCDVLLCQGPNLCVQEGARVHEAQPRRCRS
eukprot:1156184-Pelagomonas_calceolata.AAC.12